MRRATRPYVRAAEKERGSVFVVALLALVMLTVIGLSLALVTETEMLLGGNEQVITENFYAGDAGAAVAIGQALLGATDKKCFASLALETDGDSRRIGVRTLGYSIDTSSLYPVAFDIAPYSKANEGRGDVLFAGFFRGEVRALRGTWQDPGNPEDSDYEVTTVPREAGEDLDTLINNEDFILQGEKAIDLAFYVAPLQSQIDLGLSIILRCWAVIRTRPIR